VTGEHRHNARFEASRSAKAMHCIFPTRVESRLLSLKCCWRMGLLAPTLSAGYVIVSRSPLIGFFVGEGTFSR
jgi:hypothetical protein